MPTLATALRSATLACLLALASFTASLPASAQATAEEAEFVYRFRSGDTLIQVCRRLLIDPLRWPEVQRRNGIADQYRIPPDTPVRIPYEWLRLGPDTAVVQAVAGTVTRAGGVPVVQGDVLAEGERIETGADGSVSLVFADQSVVRLRKSSVLTLNRLQRIEGDPDSHRTGLGLESGRADTEVQPKRDVGRFEIATPVAISAVRGTRFRTAFDAQSRAAITETLEGAVNVAGSRGAALVNAGFGTHVDAEGSVREPVPLLDAPDLSSLAGTNSTPRLAISFPPVPRAAAYRLQLAADAEFRTLLLDESAATPAFDLPMPETGQYWLRARALDELGIEGVDAVHTVTQHIPPPTPAPPPLDAQPLGRKQMRLSWPAPGESLRVQVASDAEFTQLIADQVVSTGELVVDVPTAGTYHARLVRPGAPGAQDAVGEAQQVALDLPTWLKVLISSSVFIPLLL